ncbi:MAG: hypothetical protein JWQ88_2048, partial [Rhodoferax sp.]|nr:hypothetical protein [Rhodoferax sp.]
FIVHDAEPHAWSLGPRLRFMERRAHALSYRLASTIVTLTPSVREALVREFAIPAAKIAVIPHGPLSVGDVAPVPGSGRLLLFGSLRRNKCVLEVIQGVVLARRQGQRVSLVLAGEPLKQEPGYWNECLAAVAEDPDGFDVRAGFLPDEALPVLIGSIDAFVLAYRDFNSQSGVAILAALAGRPVIGTRSGGLGELFDQGMAGEALAEPLTAEAVADGIARFCVKSPNFWHDASQQATLAIARLLRWDRIADDYIRLARDSGPVATGRSEA